MILQQKNQCKNPDLKIDPDFEINNRSSDSTPIERALTEVQSLKCSLKIVSDYMFSKFLTLIRMWSVLILTLLFTIGAPSEVSATYPPTPEQFTGYSGYIKVVTDENGHAMAAYIEEDTHFLYSYYYSNNVWTAIPINVGNTAGGLGGLVMDSAGNALITFTDYSNNDLQSLYFNGTSWAAPATDPLSTSVNDLGSLAINSLGVAVAAWLDSSDEIRISYFTGGNWTTPSTPGDIGSGFDIHVAIDTNGDLVVGWTDFPGHFEANARHYIGGVWSIPYTNITDALVKGVGIGNGKSNVLMQIDQSNLVTGRFVYAADFNAGVFNTLTQLNPLIPPSGAPYVYLSPSIDVAPNGTAVAVFAYSQTTFNVYNLYYAQFDGTLWSPAVAFQATSDTSTTDPVVSVNSSGDALLFWGNQLPSAPNTVDYYTAELPVGGSLGTPLLVYASPDEDADGSLSVSLPDTGLSALAWTGTDGDEGQAIPYGLASLVASPPTEIDVQVCNDRFQTQRDCINTITWNASLDPGVTEYQIRKNGVLIAKVLATDPLTYQDNAPCADTIVYSVAGVIGGLPGDSVSYTVYPHCGLPTCS